MLSLLLPVTSQDMDPRCLLQEERKDDRARCMANRFSASLHCNCERIFSVASFAGASKPFSNERRPYLPVDVKSSDAALHSIRWHLQTNPTTSPTSFAFLQVPYTIMVYGLTLYIREYFNTTVPSNREFKNAKNAKIANPRSINPAKIKAHTVVNVYVATYRTMIGVAL